MDKTPNITTFVSSFNKTSTETTWGPALSVLHVTPAPISLNTDREPLQLINNHPLIRALSKVPSGEQDEKQ